MVVNGINGTFTGWRTRRGRCWVSFGPLDTTRADEDYQDLPAATLRVLSMHHATYKAPSRPTMALVHCGDVFGASEYKPGSSESIESTTVHAPTIHGAASPMACKSS